MSICRKNFIGGLAFARRRYSDDLIIHRVTDRFSNMFSIQTASPQCTIDTKPYHIETKGKFNQKKVQNNAWGICSQTTKLIFYTKSDKKNQFGPHLFQLHKGETHKKVPFCYCDLSFLGLFGLKFQESLYQSASLSVSE